MGGVWGGRPVRCCSVWVGVSNDGMSTITPTGGSCISKQLARATLAGKGMLRPRERQDGRSIGNPLLGDGAVMHRGHSNGKRRWRGRGDGEGGGWEREPLTAVIKRRNSWKSAGFFHDLQTMADGMLGKGQKDLVVASRSQPSGTDATRQQAAAGFKCAA